ncbi:MAG: hypothetical protein WCF84_19770 [Anaerolineae bacterium]
MSKLGLHIISWNQSQAILDFVGRCQPRVLKMIEFNDMDTNGVRGSSPGTLVIGRQYLNSQPLDNPTANAQYLFNQLLPAIWKMGNRIDVWEGYNEVVLNSVDDAKCYNDFTIAWANIMHSQGLRCAAYSFSAGNPDLSYWPYLVDGARACDYLALHEYDHPRMDTNAGQMCLRYRKVRALLPQDAWRPILITECGIDDGTNHGWKTYASADSYISQLAWYDSELSKDDYVIGATIFTIDGKDWADFDLLPMMRPLASYIASNPTPPPPPPPPVGGSVSISNVTLSPTTVVGGQLLNVSITVTNNSTATLQTQDPAPGLIYSEGETFKDRGFAETANAFRVGIDYDGRSGVDHPYRWGLGAPLAPGQSVTVTGAIRLNTPQVRNYWAGLVQEQVAWLQDNTGQQQITVQPAPASNGQPVITGLSFQPAGLNSGDQLNVSITVMNGSNVTLPTEGPDPGFVYNEGDTFYTRGFADINGAMRVGIDFDGRTGIDHPYRWGLGAPLAPGQSVTVTGGIRLSSTHARNYWAGLVREQIAWLQDRQGIQLITVSGGAPVPGGQPTVTAVAFAPTFVPQGQLVQVSVTIKNATNAALPTQGPQPGFIYNEGDNFLTKMNPPSMGCYRIGVDFDGRTGVDHPYRWGLGGTLAPGQSTTVTGYIRLNRRQVTNFWVALIQEGVGSVQDQLGATALTVLRS